MRLPPLDNRPGEWPEQELQSWTQLLTRVQQLEVRAGRSDAFERMLAQFREMVRTGLFDGLKALLSRRLAARALTWLWLHDEVIGPRLLNSVLLNTLVEAQKPRLTRLTLVQLAQLYFRQFDFLNERDKDTGDSLHHVIEGHLRAQLDLLPESKLGSQRPDALTRLKQHSEWLLKLEGPLTLVQQVCDQGGELSLAFEAYGLAGMDNGRYGDICRAHFYLETLRGLAPGEWHEMLDELLKPSVNKAPYEGDKRIGHAALEIMIDRGGESPGEAWQDFIINLAGDPRIASSAPNYRQWWLPLGEARINQVRGWLSKEDLRLFLRAVEQYGHESGKEDLQRMFPARKTFLEGLFKLGLIRYSRLMLGGTAHHSVRRILGAEVKTNFAKMVGNMNDKAVIYLDCGNFHLVEGSHSFKIWVYLAQPGTAVKTYDRNVFSYEDLTSRIPREYKMMYPTLDYQAITHFKDVWQNKVFNFLAENGIELDLEQLLGSHEYPNYLKRYGIPVVRREKVKIPAAAYDSVSPPVSNASASFARLRDPSAVTSLQVGTSGAKSQNHEAAAPFAVPTIREFHQSTSPSNIQSGTSVRGSTADRSATPVSRNESDVVDLAGRIARLPKIGIDVLRYFITNPGDKARIASNVLNIETREINRLLHGPLSSFCQKDPYYGWHVTEAAAEVMSKNFL